MKLTLDGIVQALRGGTKSGPVNIPAPEKLPEPGLREKPDYFVADQVAWGTGGSLGAFISELRQAGEKCGEGSVVRSSPVAALTPGNPEAFGVNYSNLVGIRSVVVSGPNGNVAFSYARIDMGNGTTSTNTVRTEPSGEELGKSGIMADKPVTIQEAVDGVCLYRAAERSQDKLNLAMQHASSGVERGRDTDPTAAALLRKILADKDRDQNASTYAKEICDAPSEMSAGALAEAGKMLVSRAKDFNKWEQERERERQERTTQNAQGIPQGIGAISKPSGLSKGRGSVEDGRGKGQTI